MFRYDSVMIRVIVEHSVNTFHSNHFSVIIRTRLQLGCKLRK